MAKEASSNSNFCFNIHLYSSTAYPRRIIMTQKAKYVSVGLLLAVCCLLGQASALKLDSGMTRRMLETPTTATAGAAGSQSASASAIATNIAGQGQATTAAQATGAGATTFGASQAQGQIDTCFSGPNENLSVCRTLAPNVRASECTDVPPDDRYTCTQQAKDFGKCDSDFIFVGSYCLSSCGRCGDGCNDDDAPSDGTACDASKCDTDAYKQEPTCLKTCGRCSVASA
ncbi:hypothetical protein Ndes2437A_g05499 [Nannochloris sp. 'desiccata']